MRRKHNHAPALSIFVLVVFVAALYTSSNPLQRYPPAHVKIITDLLQKPNHDGADVLSKEPIIDQNHRQLKISREFRTSSGFYPDTHPSQPYFVDVGENGAIISTVDYANPEHPLNRLADVRSPTDKRREKIFFFVVPKTCAGVMKAIITRCYKLKRSQKQTEPESTEYIDGVLNVDTQSLEGMARARKNKLIDSGLVDVFTTSYFLEGALMFTSKHKGRAFTILQHPVAQAENVYRARDPSLRDMSLAEFLESPNYIDNWVVRSFNHIHKGNLTEEHLVVARGILAQKFLVGIAEHLEETIRRLDTYFEWKSRVFTSMCVAKNINNHYAKQKRNPTSIEKGSREWDLIAQKDNLDLNLYLYALELFSKQGSTMFHRPYLDKEGVPIDVEAVAKKQKMMAILDFFSGN